MYEPTTNRCFAVHNTRPEEEYTLVQCTECAYEWREAESDVEATFCPVCGSDVEAKEDLGLELV